MRRVLVPLLATALIASLPGCGTKAERAPEASGGPQPQLAPPQAAEPKPGPAVQGTPKGTAVDVGARPEGVAYDPETDTFAVAVTDPPRLVVVDARTGEKRREVRLPSSARHVSLSAPGGAFLVPCEDADRLVEVPVDGGDPIETKVGDNPHDATAVGDRRFVVDEFSSTMTVVRGGRAVGTVPVDAQPGGIAGVGDRLYVNAVRAYTIEEYTPADRPEGGGAQSSGLGPSHVVGGFAQMIAISDTRGQALVVYETTPRLKFRARVPLDGTPVGLAGDSRGRVWVTLSEKNQAVPVDLRGPKPTAGAPIATTQTPLSLAVATTGRLAIAGADDGTLLLVDP